MGLLDTLFNGDGISPVQTMTGQAVDPSIAGISGPLSQGLQGLFDPNSPAMQDPYANQPPPVNDSNAPPITVTAPPDTWAPAHRSWLGRVSDALNHTNQYENQMRQQDVASAMQGFQGNPTRAIARLSQIPGMANEAWTMAQQLQSGQERGEQLKILNAARKNAMFNKLGGIAYQATQSPDPNTFWQTALPAIKNTYQMYDESVPDDLPSNYDENYAKTLIAQSETAPQQQAIQQKNQANQIRGDAVRAAAAYKAARLAQFAQQQAAVAERSRERLNQAQELFYSTHPRPFSSSDGNGVVAPGGMKAIITRPNGTMYAAVPGPMTPEGHKTWKWISEYDPSQNR